MSRRAKDRLAVSTAWAATSREVLIQTFYESRRTNSAPSAGFYRVEVTPLSSNALLAQFLENQFVPE